MDKILVVIDVQNDFVTGVLGSKEAVEALPYIQEKVNQAVEDRTPIWCTLDIHYSDYLNTQEGKNLPIPHCMNQTTGAAPALKLPSSTNFIAKEQFGSLSLAQVVEADEIEICGLVTDICVITNALLIKTLHSEVPIKIDARACAGTTPERHKAALEVMKSCQIEEWYQKHVMDKI